MNGKKISQINIGDKASTQRTISESDVYLYAGITGDLNPAHIDEETSKNSMFKGRIAHGMLTAGLISGVLGMQLPGPGTIYLSQELKFTAPVKFGDTIKAEVEVVEIIKEKIVKLKTTCTNQEGTIVLEGHATVMPPK
ncbi:3-hydroxybutyryl-CoA dehydratase [Acetoanaerobium pronyense]|uniref:3-hydroxybutyryl-CoA dehydratase n=1 Tax=Acetoanaerobium pronyense TaxID=1482736 RepID=A0ABS4KGV4_9FIRM|nr:MaoC family dehydratase [Acetoanaerobium pronyense]MBP2027014.1 3-hydroxybutyryl-CoA dehydratase [Acetoanaerobium pronyense]